MVETIKSLDSTALYKACHPDELEFDTTESLKELGIEEQGLGQQRASEAFEVALNIKSDGYNIYAMGTNITNRQSQIRHLIKRFVSGSHC